MKGIIVDCYGAGVHLAKNLLCKNVELDHVRSSNYIPIPFRATYSEEIFSNSIMLDESQELSQIDLLRKDDYDFVIAGSESGVIMADKIASFLNLAGNDVNLSKARRNKALMLERLKLNGLKTVDSVLVNTPNFEAPSDFYPMVVKPVDSGGSEDVRICIDGHAAKKAVCDILNKKNIFGCKNKAALLQKKLLGTQFMVNSISFEGHHKVTEIWKEERVHTPEGYSIYDKEVLMPHDFEYKDEIISYVDDVLTALGMQFGPAHTELFFTKDGPVLLESASRIQGGIDGEALVAALGSSQITQTVNLLLNNSSFHSIKPDYSPEKAVMLVNFIAHKAGLIKDIVLDGTVKKLSSFHSSKLSVKKGGFLSRTIDLLTKPGHLYLINESREKIFKDYENVREFEEKGKIFFLG
ncbi:ATP-grasp domain-containing protein [Modicisalibacter muralis]|uniref:ATP-grasp domain-containing protein n=1 Tax=Modicisalibacter muralis TaxID=119000 RepID=A0A1G9N1H1_9GAMM|nr:ATP-grasp domain-containing protein [Halomonas muralis]SDL80372.1 ATP-grasp domain-containing protein [Halomonas muralis]